VWTIAGSSWAATAVVKDGGLGDDISDLPAAGAALEWMSEKAVAIGHSLSRQEFLPYSARHGDRRQ